MVDDKDKAMTYDPSVHNRQSIRLKGYDYTQPGWYFITICVHKRQKVFGHIENGKMVLNQYGKIIEEEWNNTSKVRKNVTIDQFIAMPDHVHGILIIRQLIEERFDEGESRWLPLGVSHRLTPMIDTKLKPTARIYPNSVGSIMAQFKSITTKRIRKEGISNYQWQRNYYERIIRTERQLENIRRYIQNNPKYTKY